MSRTLDCSNHLLSVVLVCALVAATEWDRMVLLTMTPALVAAIEACHKLSPDLLSSEAQATDPSLEDPGKGRPISHGQIIAISRSLRKHGHNSGQALVTAGISYHLDDLLRGSRVYIEPSKPKPDPVR